MVYFRISILGNCLYGWELQQESNFRFKSQMDLAIRYMLVGLVMNFVGGWVTDFTTAYVAKQQGVTLSKTFDL